MTNLTIYHHLKPDITICCSKILHPNSQSADTATLSLRLCPRRGGRSMRDRNGARNSGDEWITIHEGISGIHITSIYFPN